MDSVGSHDASSQDAGSLDAGGLDAGGHDAGSLDAGGHEVGSVGRRQLLRRAGALAAGAGVAGAGVAGALTASPAAAVAAAAAITASEFNVKDYGAVGDGVADDTGAFQAAVNAAAAAGGGIVRVPAGVYKRGGPTIDVRGNVRIVGAGTGATTILDQSTAAGSFVCFNFQGTRGNPIALTQDAVRHQDVLKVPVASLAGLRLNDRLLLQSDAPSNPARPEATIGEFVKVQWIHGPSDSIGVWGQFRDTYRTADAAAVCRVTPVVGVGVADLTITRDADDRYHKMWFIKVEDAEDVDVRNVVTRGCGASSLIMINVFGATVNGLHCYDQPDWIDSRYDPELRYGYGVTVSCASEAIAITGCRFTRMRHGFTTTGIPTLHGRPRNIVVSGCVATQCTSGSFDTHEEAEDVSFVGCHVSNATHAAYQLRGRNCRVVNSTASYCADGVWLGRTAIGGEVKGCTFRNLGGPFTGNGGNGPVTMAARGYGVYLDSPENVLVEGNTFADLLRAGVLISGNDTGKCQRVRIAGNEIHNPGRAGDAFGVYIAASVTTVSDLSIERNRFQAYGSALSDPDSVGTISSAVRVDTPAAGITRMSVMDNSLANATELLGGAGRSSAGITVGAPLFTDNAAKGLVLRSANGTYWRVTVSDSGALTTTNIGTARPALP
ncbi:MAG TPA: right-handed parallel beta-helix repeat-containing protein [Candidatus Limnocylindrales bacterium]